MNQRSQDQIGNFQAASPLTRLRRLPWRLVGLVAALLVVGVIYLLVAAGMARQRTVFVVNGTASASKVRINGVEHQINPHGLIAIDLPEGQVVVQNGDDPAAPVEMVAIQTSLWTRPFRRPMFILNPDRAAVIVWEQMGYYENLGAVPDDKHWDIKYSAGQVLHEFEKIDYEFRPFPDQVHSGRSGVEVRRRVGIETAQWKAEPLFGMLEIEQGREAAVAQLRAALSAEPDDAARLELLRQNEGADAVIAFAQPLLDRQPLMMEVHRAAQNARLCKHQRAQLIEHYRGLVAENPDDPARIYLLARVIPDTDPEAARLMDLAAASELAPHQALHSILLREMNQTRFDRALDVSRRLRKRHPGDSHYVFHEYEALWAAGRLEEALAAADQYSRIELFDGHIFVAKAAMLHQLKRDDEVQPLIAAYLEVLRADGADLEAVDEWREFLDAHVAYVRGDPSKISLPDARESGWPAGSATAFHAAVIAGDAERIEREALILASHSSTDPGIELQAAIALMHLEQAALAQNWFDQAAVKLERTPIDSNLRLADWLRGRSVPDPRELLAQVMHTDAKLRMLIALGMRHPQVRDELFEAARPLNFDRRTPHLLFREILE